MGLIASSQLTTIMDSVASAKLIFDAGVGTTSSQSNTVAKAAANDVNTITAIADNDVQADLSWWFRLRQQALLASSLYTTLGVYNIWVALEKHLSGSSQVGVAGLDTYLQVNNIRVNEGCKDVGFPLSPEQIMPPAVDPMATFAVTGSGVGTYTHVADIDTTQYGRAWLQAYVTSSSGLGSNAITATVTGLQFDHSTTTSKQITLAAATSYGGTVSIGTLGTQADSYDYVTNITITGGTNGDGFAVRSLVERTISAAS